MIVFVSRLEQRYLPTRLIPSPPLNVLGKAAITALVPTLDVLFNCAGFVYKGSILEAKKDEWDIAFNLNPRSQFWRIQAVLPRMLGKAKTSSGASIINRWRYVDLTLLE